MSDSNTPAVPISPVTTTRPELTISRAAINDEPIELDSSPLSPAAAARRTSRAGDSSALADDDADRTLTPAEQEVGIPPPTCAITFLAEKAEDADFHL